MTKTENAVLQVSCVTKLAELFTHVHVDIFIFCTWLVVELYSTSCQAGNLRVTTVVTDLNLIATVRLGGY